MKTSFFRSCTMLIGFQVLVCLSMSGFSWAQETGKMSSSSDDFKRFSLEIMLNAGLGLDKHDVAKTADNKDITISGGGGVGGALYLGYRLTAEAELNVGYGFQSSSLEPKVENADAEFKRNALYILGKYRIPVTEKGVFKIGAGIGFYTPDELDLDLSEVPGGGHNKYSYENSSGMVLLADYESYINESMSWGIGVKFYTVTYSLESGILDGIPFTLEALPATIKDEIGELDGGGIDLTVSFLLHF